LLVEGAWHYTGNARAGKRLERRRRGCPLSVIEAADRALQRLHKKYMRLLTGGKHKNVAVTAAACRFYPGGTGFSIRLGAMDAGRMAENQVEKGRPPALPNGGLWPIPDFRVRQPLVAKEPLCGTQPADLSPVTAVLRFPPCFVIPPFWVRHNREVVCIEENNFKFSLNNYLTRRAIISGKVFFSGYIPTYFVSGTLLIRPKGRGMYPSNTIKGYGFMLNRLYKSKYLLPVSKRTRSLTGGANMRTGSAQLNNVGTMTVFFALTTRPK
jgi:hypothetical protein